MLKVYRVGDHYAFDFFSVADMRDYIATMPVGSRYAALRKGINSQRTDPWYVDFSRSASYAEAEKMLDYGCPEIAENLAKVVCKTQKIELKNSFVRQQAGFVPVVASWLCGDPQSMLTVKRQRRQARVIDVVFCVVFDCHVSAADIIRGQSRGLSVVRALEESGLRVNLWVAMCSCKMLRGGGNLELAFYLRLKKAEEKLNVLKLSYPLCHPSFLRRHSFALTERTAAANVPEFTSGYGACISNCDLIDFVKKTKKIGENAIVLPAELNDNIFYEFLKKQNCEFAEKALTNF